MRRIALILAAISFALPLCAESGSVLQMDFSNPGLHPPHWTLIIRQDGSGHFHSERANTTTADPEGIDAPGVDRDIRLSARFVERVFQTAHYRALTSGPCESHMKVAFQGWKTLTYSGPEGKAVCQFNYAKDREIQSLGDSLVSVAATILEGARLEFLLQYDRLGLDKETEYLFEAARDGRLQQVCVIRGILERLSEDQVVMERVRRRARQILTMAEK
jgi:hypothetical protein